MRGHIQSDTASAASFAFVVLAVLSTFAIGRSDQLSRYGIMFLKRIGLHDLDRNQTRKGGHGGRAAEGHGEPRRVIILGFFRAASALLNDIERRNDALLDQIGVVDFNPVVFSTLSARRPHVTYGDITTWIRWSMPESAAPRSSF